MDQLQQTYICRRRCHHRHCGDGLLGPLHRQRCEHQIHWVLLSSSLSPLFSLSRLPLLPILLFLYTYDSNRYERVWFQQKVTEWVGDGSNRRAIERIVDHRQNKEFFKTVCSSPLLSSPLLPLLSSCFSFLFFSFPFFIIIVIDVRGLHCPRIGSTRSLQLPLQFPFACGM